MTTSSHFKDAHAMTRATLQAGDNYAVTFGQCLKYIKTMVKAISSGAFKAASITPDQILTLEGVEAYNVKGWVMDEDGRAYVGEFSFKAERASKMAAYYLQNFDYRHLELECHMMDDSKKVFNLLTK